MLPLVDADAVVIDDISVVPMVPRTRRWNTEERLLVRARGRGRGPVYQQGRPASRAAAGQALKFLLDAAARVSLVFLGLHRLVDEPNEHRVLGFVISTSSVLSVSFSRRTALGRL